MNRSPLAFGQISILAIFLILAFVSSCNEEESQIDSTETQNVSSEANLDSYFEDVDDIIATAALATEVDLGGRKAKLDDRFCDNVKVTFQHQSNADSDTITVDFGQNPGCTDPRGNHRKGKITIIFQHGSRFQPGSAVVTTLNDFSLNGLKIEGTRTITLISLTPPTQKIELAGGKITWPNNTTITRDAQHLRKWDKKGTPARSDDEMVIFGSDDFPAGASGENRDGKEYTVQIQQDIIFKVKCGAQNEFLPVSGRKLISIQGKTAIVDYGSGSCDNIITVSINGESREVTVTRM